MQRFNSFTIDLTKTKGKGEIKCPKCGAKISPEDETEDVYTILEIAMKENEIDRITLQCNRCRSQILLTGFHLLDKMR